MTMSVIITYALLLPYQSVDCVVLTFNRAGRGHLSTVEDSREGKDDWKTHEGAAESMSCNQKASECPEGKH